MLLQDTEVHRSNQILVIILIYLVSQILIQDCGCSSSVDQVGCNVVMHFCGRNRLLAIISCRIDQATLACITFIETMSTTIFHLCTGIVFMAT